MGYLDTFKGLPRNIYIIFFAQVINRFGDFVLPFLTLFLVNKLGLSFETAGFGVMISTLMSIPGAYAGGKFSDHYGRKKTYLFFQSSAALMLLLCAFTNDPTAIIVLVSISCFFNGGVRPVMSAIISDVLPSEKRQAGFSLSYLGINLGVAIGPIAAGFLFNNYIKWIFIGDAITSFIAILLMMTFIKESLPDYTKDHETPELEKTEKGHIFQALAKRPQIVLFLSINIIFSIVYTQHMFSLPLMMSHVFGTNGPKNFGILCSLNAVTVLVMTMFVSGFAVKKNLKPLQCIALAGLLYGVGFGMIGFINTMPLFLISTFIWTLGEILVVTNFGVYLANNSPQNFRARFSAVSTLSWSIGGAFGTAGVGLYISAFGITAIWPALIIISVVGAAGMLALDRVKK